MTIKLKDLMFDSKKVNLKKNTAQDKVHILADSIRHAFEVGGCSEWAYYQDHDDTYIYFMIWCCQKERYCSWAISYTYSDGVVELGEDVQEVVQMTDWKFLTSTSEDTEKSLVNTINKCLKEFFKKSDQVSILKDFDDEQMISIEPIWKPAGEVDAHGDTISLEEVRKMVDNINQKIDKGTLKAGLFHCHETNVYKWNRAWVQEVDAQLGDSIVKAGTPLISAQWLNKEAWEDKKSGKLMAPSFGGTGDRHSVES